MEHREILNAPKLFPLTGNLALTNIMDGVPNLKLTVSDPKIKYGLVSHSEFAISVLDAKSK